MNKDFGTYREFIELAHKGREELLHVIERGEQRLAPIK